MGFLSSQELQKKVVNERGREERIGGGTNLVTNGMMVNAVKRKRSVEDSTSVTNVEKVDTEERNVRRLEIVPKRPKYLERSVWTDVDASPSCSPTASCTLIDKPLPRPPS